MTHRQLPLPFYFIAYDDGHPGNHGVVYGDTRNRNYSGRSYGDSYNHSHSHNHSHNRSRLLQRSPTTSHQPEAESRAESVFYSYHHSLSFVFIYLDGSQAILFKFQIVMSPL